MIVGISLFLNLVGACSGREGRLSCPRCALLQHDLDAVYCKACGQMLQIRTRRYAPAWDAPFSPAGAARHPPARTPWPSPRSYAALLAGALSRPHLPDHRLQRRRQRVDLGDGGDQLLPRAIPRPTATSPSTRRSACCCLAAARAGAWPAWLVHLLALLLLAGRLAHAWSFSTEALRAPVARRRHGADRGHAGHRRRCSACCGA